MSGTNRIKISRSDAKKLASKYKINLNIVPLDMWHYGLGIELEHGTKMGKLTDITHDDINITAKIVIAHLKEFPDYYERLIKMEQEADKYWEKHFKPSIFINDQENKIIIKINNDDNKYKYKSEKYKQKYLELKKLSK